MLRIAICDDDELFLDFARECITDYMQNRNVKYDISSFFKGEDLLRSLNTYDTYDLVFLDVEMPGTDGMRLARCIREKNPSTPIAFISAYIKYSLDGYKVNAFRYILKDTNSLRGYIGECIDSVIRLIDKNKLCMKFDFLIGERKLFLKDILYLESSKNYVNFVLKTPTYEPLKLRKSLRVLTDELSDYGFIALNSKCTVNLSHVKNVSRYQACLYDGRCLSISQKKYNEVSRRYLLYEGSNL